MNNATTSPATRLEELTEFILAERDRTNSLTVDEWGDETFDVLNEAIDERRALFLQVHAAAIDTVRPAWEHNTVVYRPDLEDRSSFGFTGNLGGVHLSMTARIVDGKAVPDPTEYALDETEFMCLDDLQKVADRVLAVVALEARSQVSDEPTVPSVGPINQGIGDQLARLNWMSDAAKANAMHLNHDELIAARDLAIALAGVNAAIAQAHEHVPGVQNAIRRLSLSGSQK